MPKQLFIERIFFLFHAIVCHFLVNEKGGGGFEKNDKVSHGGGDFKNVILWVTYFLNGPILVLSWTYL